MKRAITVLVIGLAFSLWGGGVVGAVTLDTSGTFSCDVTMTLCWNPDYLSHFPWHEDNAAYVTGREIILRGGQPEGLAERMRILQNGTVVIGGNVLIGTPAFPLLPGLFKLEVGSADKIVASFGNTSTNNSGVVQVGLSSRQSQGLTLRAALVGGREGANNGYFAIKTRTSGGETEKLRVTGTGRVGIGTQDPNRNLTIGDRGDTTGVYENILNDKHEILVGVGSAAIISAMTASDLQLRTNNDTRMVIQANTGNVGIGTASPQRLLHLSKTTSPEIMMSNTGNAVDAKHVQFQVDASGTLQMFPVTDAFGTQATGLAIDRSGDVGIGTTAPSKKVHVYEDVVGSSEILRLQNGNAAGRPYLVVGGPGVDSGIIVGSCNDVSNVAFISHTGLSPCSTGAGILVTIVGNVGIGTTSPAHPLHMGSGAHVTVGGVWTNASSRAYKEGIRDLTVDEALDTLSGLNPVTFRYKVASETHVGFIAEDVPDLVATPDRKGLSPMDVVAVLTKVVQEQQKTIEGLSARLAEMERRQ